MGSTAHHASLCSRCNVAMSCSHGCGCNAIALHCLYLHGNIRVLQSAAIEHIPAPLSASSTHSLTQSGVLTSLTHHDESLSHVPVENLVG